MAAHTKTASQTPLAKVVAFGRSQHTQRRLSIGETSQFNNNALNEKSASSSGIMMPAKSVESLHRSNLVFQQRQNRNTNRYSLSNVSSNVTIVKPLKSASIQHEDHSVSGEELHS